MQKTTVLTPDFVRPDVIRESFEQAAKTVGAWAWRTRAADAGVGTVTRAELGRLLEAARAMNRCESAAALLDRALSDLLVMLPCRGAAIALLGEDARVVDVRSVGEKLEGGDGMHAGQPLPEALARVVRQGSHLSWTGMIVPLQGREGPVGVLQLSFERRRDAQAGQVQRERAEALAEVVADAYENLRARLRAVQEAEQAAAEKERARLSRDLHDSVSQSLFGVSMGVRTGLGMLNDADGAREPIAFALDLADAAFTQMRALIFEMRSDCLQEEGMLRGLRRQCAAIAARHKTEFGAELNIRLCENEPAMPAPLREAMYRIAVEAMQNAGKHAHASEIVVDLREDDEAITLTIRDDDRGFDPDATYHGHLGLKSMRERAEAAGAALHFESAPGCGTKIEVRWGKGK